MEVMFYMRIVFVALFTILQMSYELLRKIKWWITGFHHKISSCQIKQSMENRTVQVEKILFRYKADLIVQSGGKENFVTSHAGFVTPSYLLAPNVTLYAVLDNEVLFVESEPDVNVFDPDIGGVFLGVPQFLYAKNLLCAPMWVFLELSQRIGPPKTDLLFVTMTTRCGSTLMLQILNATGKCHVVSEPTALQLDLSLMQTTSMEQKDKILQSAVNMLCKATKPGVTLSVIKLTTTTMGFIDRLHHIYPNAKRVHMYRNGLDVVRSVCRTLRQMPWLFLFQWAIYLSKATRQKLLQATGLETNIKQSFISYYGLFTITWATGIYQHLKDVHNKCNVPAIKYEDFIAEPYKLVSELFNMLNLPFDLVLVDGELSKDSQRGTPFSRDILNKYPPFVSQKFTRRDIDYMNNICEQLNVPHVTEDIVLPFTLGRCKY